VSPVASTTGAATGAFAFALVAAGEGNAIVTLASETADLLFGADFALPSRVAMAAFAFSTPAAFDAPSGLPAGLFAIDFVGFAAFAAAGFDFAATGAGFAFAGFAGLPAGAGFA
jgi:hypothetical protein